MMNPFETAEAGPSEEKPFKCEDCGKVYIYNKSNETDTITVILYFTYSSV